MSFMRSRSLLILLLAGCALGACATPGEYMGIDITEGAEQRAALEGSAAPSRVSLARRAKLGDKQAQVTLGLIFEHGIGVQRDWKKARKLYRAAAGDTGGKIWIYTPGTSGAAGRVMPYDTGPEQHGLGKAKLLLEQLEAKMAKRASEAR